MSQIKLHLDVIEGTLDLECSGEDFEAIMSRIEGMMKNLMNVPRRKTADVREEPGDIEQEIAEGEDASATNGKTAKKPRRRKGSGHANWFVEMSQ